MQKRIGLGVGRVIGACIGLVWTAGLAAQEAHVAVGWNDRDSRLGMVGAVSTRAPFGFLAEPIQVGPDPLLRFAGGRVFVLNSADDSVRVIDPASWTVDRSFSLGTDSIPTDIAVAGPSTAYVTTRDGGEVFRVNLASGDAQVVLDLAELTGKGVPQLGTMEIDNGRLFVQVRSLDRDDPLAPPHLAVVDLATERLIDADPMREGTQLIDLAGTAPKGKMQVVGANRKLWINAGGGFFDAGGIEAVDLNALRSDGLIVREDAGETGADLNAFVMLNPEQGYLTYSTDLLASSHLHRFSADGMVEVEELNVVVDYITPAMVHDPATHHLFLPSGGFDIDGINVFDAATGRQLTPEPIGMSGPPTDLVLIPEPGSFGLVIAPLLAGFWKRRRTGAA